MCNFVKKTSCLLIAISLVSVNSAYAMKRAREDDNASNQLIAVSNQTLTDYQVNNLPSEILIEIFKKLSLEDLSVSYVSKKWFQAAQRACADFYHFQKTYHECKGSLKKDTTFNYLKQLREAYAQLKATGLSDQEISALAQAFLTKNYDSITKTIGAPSWLREIEFKKYPERWMQLALLRIWDTVPPIDKAPLKDYDDPFLKMLAPADDLVTFFSNEADFETQCELASELCERGPDHLLTVTGQALTFFGQGQWLKAAKLYDIALKKDANVLSAFGYANAAYAHYMLNNWQRSTELYELALKKDANVLTAFDYANAAHTHSMLNNWQRTTELYELALKKDANILNALGYTIAAHAHYVLKNWQRSAELYELALKKDANVLKAFDYANAAHIHSMLKNWQRTAELYELALKKDANILNALGYTIAAHAHYVLKNWQRSTELYELALEKGPLFPAAGYKEAAMAYLHLNNQQRSAELQEMARVQELKKKAEKKE